MYEFDANNTSLTESEIKQLALLLTTPEGTVVLDRDFGFDPTPVDMPTPLATTIMASDLAEKIEKYIPGLRLREVIPNGYELDGKQKYKVVVDRVDG